MEERTVTLRNLRPSMCCHLPGVCSSPPGMFICPQGVLHSCPPDLMELILGHTLFFLGDQRLTVTPRLPLPKVRGQLGWSLSPGCAQLIAQLSRLRIPLGSPAGQSYLRREWVVEVRGLLLAVFSALIPLPGEGTQPGLLEVWGVGDPRLDSNTAPPNTKSAPA